MNNLEIKELNQVNQLIEVGKIGEAFQIISELEGRKDFSRKEILACKLVKAKLFRLLGDYLSVIKYAESIFQESQENGDLLLSYDALTFQAYSYIMMLNLTKGEVLLNQAKNSFETIKETILIDLREREAFLLKTEGVMSFYKGEILTSLEFNKKAYNLVKDTDDTVLISASLSNIAEIYFHLKEYDHAIEYAKNAVKFNNRVILPHALKTLIKISLIKGDIKEAKDYLDYFHDHSDLINNRQHTTFYIFFNALILKSSLRARDRVKSEDLFKSIALDSKIPNEERIEPITSLCELYLNELRMTKDPKIIDDIQPFIQELLTIARNQHLFFILAETYNLQAKLSLLTSEIKKAKRFLTQAQKIADTYGLKRLAMEISNEHDKLLNQEKIWESLEKSDLSLSERLELAGLNENVEFMKKKGIMEVLDLSDEEPVLFLIMTEGGVPLFMHPFIEDNSFESHLFGGFLTTIDYFIKEMFSEGLDRAIFGEHTLLMKSVPPFFISYIFKGNSYYALQKADDFIEIIQNDESIWNKLLNYLQANRSIHLHDIPKLDSLVTEIFVANTAV